MATQDEMRKIVVAYMASGNSVEDLVTQLIATLHPPVTLGEETTDPFEQAYHEILKDTTDAHNEAPESFETTAEEELKYYLDRYNSDLLYSYNSPILG
jgi:hypothetical protein